MKISEGMFQFTVRLVGIILLYIRRNCKTFSFISFILFYIFESIINMSVSYQNLVFLYLRQLLLDIFVLYCKICLRD